MAVTRAVLLALLFAMPAAAQRHGCEYSRALSALRAGGGTMTQATGARALLDARAMSERAATALQEAARVLQGCGCPLLAEGAEDAAGLAWRGAYEPSLPDLRRTLERAGMSLRMLRSREERQGCL